jgi:hypothetical protein
MSKEIDDYNIDIYFDDENIFKYVISKVIKPNVIIIICNACMFKSLKSVVLQSI